MSSPKSSKSDCSQKNCNPKLVQEVDLDKLGSTMSCCVDKWACSTGADPTTVGSVSSP